MDLSFRVFAFVVKKPQWTRSEALKASFLTDNRTDTTFQEKFWSNFHIKCLGSSPSGQPNPRHHQAISL